jgi:catechol 2,3-dioxygenase-like lactoylglutathione lyase family enzyme
MNDENPSAISHVSLGTNDFDRAVRFYDARARPPGERSCHIGFMAVDKAQVHTFHKAALAAGARDEGAPGPRPDYGEPYDGCFVRDPDGHKIEASYWDMALVKKLYLDK